MCVDISYEDIRDLSDLSQQVLSKLPTDQDLECIDDRDPTIRMAKFYIRQGRFAIQLLADCFEAGRLDTAEAGAIHTLLIQSEQMLGAAVASAAPGGQSCTGRCSSEKRQCKDNCQKKFCGCLWEAFLCKSNCFFSLNVDVNPVPS